MSHSPTLDISFIIPQPKEEIPTKKVRSGSSQRREPKFPLRIYSEPDDTSLEKPQRTISAQGPKIQLKIFHAPPDSDNQETIYLDESQFRKLMGLGELTDDEILRFAYQVDSYLGLPSQTKPDDPYIESVMNIYNSEFIQRSDLGDFIQTRQFISGHKIDLDKLFKNILGVFIRHNKYENAELLIKLYKKIHPSEFSQYQKNEIFSEYREAFYGTEQLLITNLDALIQLDSSHPSIKAFKEFLVNLKNQFINFARLFGGLGELAKFADPQKLSSDEKESIFQQEHKLLSIMPDSEKSEFESFFKQISGIPDKERREWRIEYDECRDV